MRRLENWISLVGKTINNITILRLSEICNANCRAIVRCNLCSQEKEMFISSVLDKKRKSCGCKFKPNGELSKTPFIAHWYRIKNNTLFKSAHEFFDFCKAVVPDFTADMKNWRIDRKSKYLPYSQSNAIIKVKNDKGKVSAYSQ